MFRQAYHEAPEYVPLLRRAYELWRELEAESGKDLLRITGVLTMAPRDRPAIRGALESARLFGLPHEQLTAEDMERRFPFKAVDGFVGFYEPSGGILWPEHCVGAHLDLATRYGAELRFSEPVISWTAQPAVASVKTSRGRYRARRLVIAAGPWSAELLNGTRIPLSVWRVVNAHFQPRITAAFPPDRCPAFLGDVPEGRYYGFPSLPGQGVKIGRHDTGEVCTPSNIRRTVDRWEVGMLRSTLNRYLPGAGGTLKRTLTCMYTLTPDRHFVIELHSQHPEVVYVCACSGHGFKFSPVIGEILADLAENGSTAHPIGAFSSSRFSG
jgi:sarcosine oxidase